MKTLRVDSAQISEAARVFVEGLKLGAAARVAGLSGELGAGKTTFTQAVARVLGVAETVTSPTFVIEKIYRLSSSDFTHLIHIDAYRLESGKELERLGWREIAADPHNLILIEWPEKVADILPSDTMNISFSVVSETMRDITFAYL